MRCCTGFNRWHETLRVTDHGVRLELSAFLVIVWYTYRNKSALKFSALIRTIAAEATVYFLVMVAAQVYIQLSLSLMEVLSLSRFLLYFMIVDDCFRVLGKNFRSCEYATNSNDVNSRLTILAPRAKGIWTVRLPCVDISSRCGRLD